MMADELLNVQDLIAAKKHDTFHSEVITGKTGGLSTGADIDYATNAVTGQVQKTLPKILDDIDWSYVGLFADGVTFTDKTDFAVDAVGTQWIYTGSLPFTATAGTVPSEPPYQVVHVKSASAISNTNGGSVQDFIDAQYTTVEELATGKFSVGQYVRLVDRMFGKFKLISGNVFDAYSALNAGTNKVAIYQHEKSEVWLEHLGGMAGTDVTNALNAMKVYAKDNNLKMRVGGGEFTITDEIDFSFSCNMECAVPNGYDRGEGTIWIVDVDDPLKFGFNFGKSDKVISPYVNYLKFKPVSECAAAMYLNCATFNGSKFIFDSNNLQYNGLLIEDWYIGEINNIEGSGDTYMMKVTGNTSGVIRNVNAGAVADNANAHSVQIADLVDGLFRIENIYLEAQERRNMIITDCNNTATILIDKIYEETQTYPVEISNSNSVQIQQYRTNLSDKGIVVSNSKGVNIGVLPVGAFEKNPAVTVLDDSDVSVTVLQNNFSGSMVDGRDYSLILGELSGESSIGAVSNGYLLPSANKTKLPFSNGAVVADVPANLTQRISNTSIQLDAGEAIALPLLSLRKGKRYAIKLVYKSDGGENACLIRLRNGSILKTFASFNVASTEFRTLTFVFEAPETQANRYTGLNFENVSGTAVVHQFSMCEIGSGSLPSRIVNNELHVKQEITLSTSKLIPLVDAGEGLKVNRYELQYSSTATSGATVEIGLITNIGSFSKFVTFNSAGGAVGQLEQNMTTTVDLKDQLVLERGLAVNVVGGGSGTAIVHAYLSNCENALTLE